MTAPRAHALDLLRQHGDCRLGYLGLHPDKRLFFASDRSGYVAFRVAAGFALALGHPVGPLRSWPRVLDEFRGYCADRRLGVAFCGVEASARPFFESEGFATLKVGDDARIDLTSFTTVGGRGARFRSALNRARRHGVTFEWLPAEARTPRVLTELEQVSAEWLGRRPYPELEYALGSIDTIRDPHVRLGVAREASGRVAGFVSWLPSFGARGWILDLMRRRPTALSRVMDFLITQSLLAFQREECPFASLGGSPLSNVGRERGGVLRWAMDRIYQHVNVGYGFKSLLRYKAKFRPRWEPLYLACAPGSSLLWASCAVARAVGARVRPRHLLRAALTTLGGLGADAISRSTTTIHRSTRLDR
jgi:lysylphosphatidylglycerol synthetase-like protein (DUF2156 family)